MKMNIKKRILNIFELNNIKLPDDIKVFLNYTNGYSMNEVWFNTCFLLNVSPYYAKGKIRSKEYVEARQYFYIIMLNDKDKIHSYTLTQIGDYIGQHHATVLYAKKRLLDLNENKKFIEFYKKYEQL